MSTPEAQAFLDEECSRAVLKLKRIFFDQLPLRDKTEQTSTVEPTGRKLTLRTHVKQESPDRLLVVVQGHLTERGLFSWLGMKLSGADGFRRYADGRFEMLDEETLREYR